MIHIFYFYPVSNALSQAQTKLSAIWADAKIYFIAKTIIFLASLSEVGVSHWNSMPVLVYNVKLTCFQMSAITQRNVRGFRNVTDQLSYFIYLF